MRRTEALKNLLRENNVRVMYDRVLDETDGLYFNDGTSAYITVAPDISLVKQFTALAHEAGHHFTGLTKHEGRDEERANRWAVNELISPRDIVEATLKGCQSYHELCETLNLDEEFIRTSILIFRSIYGEGVEVGDYYLNLNPIWVKEIKTGRIWPED